MLGEAKRHALSGCVLQMALAACCKWHTNLHAGEPDADRKPGSKGKGNAGGILTALALREGQCAIYET